ncbi:hypothetical protein ES703_14966 [subsurface metagenome]
MSKQTRLTQTFKVGNQHLEVKAVTSTGGYVPANENLPRHPQPLDSDLIDCGLGAGMTGVAPEHQGMIAKMLLNSRHGHACCCLACGHKLLGAREVRGKEAVHVRIEDYGRQLALLAAVLLGHDGHGACDHVDDVARLGCPTNHVRGDDEVRF